MPFKLADCDPSAKPFSTGDKQLDKAAVEALAIELDELQNLFYADKRFKLLVVLQGTDTSGKDGTLRGVFNLVDHLVVGDSDRRRHQPRQLGRCAAQRRR